jgi:PAS domain S-box-containing protein
MPGTAGSNSLSLSVPSLDPRAARLLDLYLNRSSGHAVICMDPGGIVLAWLGASESIFGFTAPEAEGRPLSQIFTPDDQARGLDKYELEVAAMNSRSEDDRWHMRKDRTRIWASGTVIAVRERNGELLGFVKVVRDRTDLRSQVETLEAQNAVLRESRERTRAFLRTLGHELRNPLAPLSNATHIISRATTDPRAVAALTIVTRQVAALTRLADDLMDVARLEAGKVVLNLKPVDLRLLLRDATDAVQKDAQQKGLRLEALLPHTPLVVAVDEDRFHRVMLNLLSNSIKYTPSGGHVWVKANQDGHEVVIRIEDTGIGISPEMLPRIFELFTQARDASDMVPGGLGVGLAMVKELVEMHGGTVQARSDGEGKGAEFSVRVPIRPLQILPVDPE